HHDAPIMSPAESLSQTCRSAIGPALGNPKFRKSARNHPALRRRAHLFVDIQDPAVDADVKRPARRARLILVDDAVGLRGFLERVAEERIVETERRGKRSYRVR